MLTLLLSKPDSKITDYRSLTDRDHEKILEWNRKVPEVVDRCIHDVIQDHLMIEPESESVLAWDGSLTRRRLDELSSRLALELVELGIGPEVRVALCFEKSVSHFVGKKTPPPYLFNLSKVADDLTKKMIYIYKIEMEHYRNARCNESGWHFCSA